MAVSVLPTAEMVEQGIESARVYVQSDVISKRLASRRAHQGHPAAAVVAAIRS